MISTTESLYSLLEVEKGCSASELKRAYYKLALIHHPDRNNDSDANEKFQKISMAYEVLSDPHKREIYDQTGRIDGLDEASLEEFMKSMHEKITIDKLNEFKEYYVGSAEELEDILVAYIKHKGNMIKILDTVYYGDISDQNRYFQIIDRCIQRGIVPFLPKFKLLDVGKIEKSRLRAEKEAAEAEKMLKELIAKNPEYANLGTGILAKRKRNNDELIARLEQKYLPKSKSKSRK